MSRSEGILSPFLEKQRNALAAKYAVGTRILDVGCNAGHFRTFLPSGTTYVGVDPHAPASTAFEFHSLGALDNLSALGKFDTIAFIATIEHIHAYQEATQNLAKSLASGGRLIVTTPTKLGDKLHHLAADVGVVSKDAADEHDHIFTLEELARVLENAGLNIVAKKTFLLGMNQLIVGEKKN